MECFGRVSDDGIIGRGPCYDHAPTSLRMMDNCIPHVKQPIKVIEPATLVTPNREAKLKSQ